MENKLKNLKFTAIINLAAATDAGYQGINLTIQGVFGIITGLACWFTRFALILVVIYIVIYGIKFMKAQGNPTSYEEAKKSFNWGLVGVLVILGTYTIILSVADFIGGPTASLALSRFIPLTCP
ncbi:MAG: hypothetical protein HYT64_02275 [Candidatus Yanofskybacteria bacterium]|nr:hypothetical protein [Candidatus Yanofskybacteria bacterium]